MEISTNKDIFNNLFKDYKRAFGQYGYADQIDHPLPVQFTALLPICLTTPLLYS